MAQVFSLRWQHISFPLYRRVYSRRLAAEFDMRRPARQAGKISRLDQEKGGQ